MCPTLTATSHQNLPQSFLFSTIWFLCFLDLTLESSIPRNWCRWEIHWSSGGDLQTWGNVCTFSYCTWLWNWLVGNPCKHGIFLNWSIQGIVSMSKFAWFFIFVLDSFLCDVKLQSYLSTDYLFSQNSDGQGGAGYQGIHCWSSGTLLEVRHHPKATMHSSIHYILYYLKQFFSSAISFFLASCSFLQYPLIVSNAFFFYYTQNFYLNLT